MSEPGHYGRTTGERVTAAEEQIDVLDREMARVRARLHDLESDRATLRLLMEQGKALGQRVAEMTGGMEALAQRVAEKTVALALSDQRQIGEIRDERKRDKLRTWLQALAVGISAGGFVTAVVYGLISQPGG